MSFEVFSLSKEKSSSVSQIVDHELDRIVSQVTTYIAGLREKAPVFSTDLTPEEIQEIRELAKKLSNFCKNKNPIIISPDFAGCGRLNSCRGDIIAEKTLYEVKSGGRAFRSIDLRQLILYLTLNKLSNKHEIENLALYNPREGFHFEMPYNEFCINFSGLSSEELCHRVSYELMLHDSGRFD